jgi:hypothetical protein
LRSVLFVAEILILSSRDLTICLEERIGCGGNMSIKCLWQVVEEAAEPPAEPAAAEKPEEAACAAVEQPEQAHEPPAEEPPAADQV